MRTAYLIVTVVAALWVGFSAFSLLRRAPFVVEPLVTYGVPETWWTPLGLAKAAGSSVCWSAYSSRRSASPPPSA
ncbi:DoxX family protein [Nocardia mangyaensis]|uniref:DoxX family protein n=1 Tax=Nocardia mangyaensis TaxID=2213200 RepID=UPI0026B56C7C